MKKNMSRRLLSFLLVTCLLAGLFSCGNGEHSVESTAFDVTDTAYVTEKVDTEADSRPIAADSEAVDIPQETQPETDANHETKAEADTDQALLPDTDSETLPAEEPPSADTAELDTELSADRETENENDFPESAESDAESESDLAESTETDAESMESETDASVETMAEVQFHFIDIGQGDAALIRTPAGDVLIDAGDNTAEALLMAYLNRYDVDRLAYVVFTHPDADHIGGADVVLKNCDVERIIRPDLAADTKTYRDMITLIQAEDCEEIFPSVGYTFSLGDVLFTVLAPIGKAYSSGGRNNYSVVIRVDYGDTSVLFTGDAESESENEMLKKYGKQADGILDCDILKVGHHGSKSSSGLGFLRAVTPDFAVISCGRNNAYNHPATEVVNRYASMNIPLYRTDLLGSIVFISDGGEPQPLAA